ncbi:MAG: hypothetical protein LBP33_03725 [Candidatus Adiutrix sp.]|jgi:ferredoxin|nr:hypothetical protein [Candidatus Adiutrix sp.]
MGAGDPADFTRDYLEAGRQLTERDLWRDRLAAADGPVPAGPERLRAKDNFLADILADPELAAACSDFLPSAPGLAAGGPDLLQRPPELPPWTYPPSAAGGGGAPPAAWSGEGAELLKDFNAKVAALLAGAALAGAAPLDEKYLYSHSLDGRPIRLTGRPGFDPEAGELNLPRRADRVLILAFIRFPEILAVNPILARLRPAAGWLNWPQQVAATLKMADFLRRQGALAWPSAGGILMGHHLGALAGLGELGRPGLLISPEYGPNLRLFSIITDYPFELGRPLNFGVADYCETCQRCINECPAKALAGGGRRPGFYPWPVDWRACFDRWLEKKDLCRKCLDVCPYTREPLITLHRKS